MNAEAFIGQFAAIARRMIVQSGEVAKQAAPKISNGQYTANDWITTATQLADIAALGFIEAAENAIAGPGVASAPVRVTSDKFDATGSTDNPRKLTFTKQLARAGTMDQIPNTKVTFVSAGTGSAPGVLPIGTKDFRFKVDVTDLPSGVYTGEVTVALDSGTFVELVKVDIAL